MSRAIDTWVVYEFISRISQDWKDTEAFKLGLINAKGKKLKDATTSQEKDALTPFDRLIFNIKRILNKLGMNSKVSAFAAALFLLKETQSHQFEHCDDVSYLAENFAKEFKEIKQDLQEDAPVNNVGGGAIAGVQEPFGRFGGARVFRVGSNTYHNARFPKKKHSRYKKYVDETDDLEGIRQYANKNPGRAIILMNKSDGSMYFLRHSNKKSMFGEGIVGKVLKTLKG